MNKLSSVRSIVRRYKISVILGNLILNPYFSSPSVGANTYTYIASSSLGIISNWTFSGTTYGILMTSGITPWSDTILSVCPQSLSIQFNGAGSYTVSQSVTLAVGKYTVSLYAHPRPSGYYNVLQTLTAFLNGTSSGCALTTSSGWTQFTFVTTVTTAGSYPLPSLFAFNSSGDTSISITAISVSLSP